MKNANMKQINVFLVLMIIVLVVFAIFLVAYQKSKYSNVYFKYNGFDVHKVSLPNKVEVYKISLVSLVDNKLYAIESRYHPSDLEGIPVNINLDDIYSKKSLFITMNPNSTGISVLAATEISKVTGNSYIFKDPKETFGALTGPVEGKNITVITCNDVNKDVGVISLELTNKSQIYSRNGCIVLEGKSESDLVKVADRLMLLLVGIMKH